MRKILFSGFNWEVKNACGERVGPGPNFFSSRNSSVFVDGSGLHLTTSFYDGKYFSSEVALDTPLGFGEYVFTLAARVDNLDPYTVCAGFLYEDDAHEIDIEFSEAMAGKKGGQFVIQPGSHSGNLLLFSMPEEVITTHSILWTPERVLFRSVSGADSNGARVIAEWEYRGIDIPQSPHARMIFNLWMYKGKEPIQLEEVVISDFHFIKATDNVITESREVHARLHEYGGEEKS